MKTSKLLSVLFMIPFGLIILHSPVSAAEKFPDVEDGMKSYTPVEFLLEKGIVHGYPDGSFQAEEQLNRAEAAVMIARLLEVDQQENHVAPFTDVKQDAWYANAVNALYEERIMVGLSDHHFGPKEIITRAQVARIIVEAYDFHMKEDFALPYEDVKENAWYEKDVKTLYAYELIRGTSATTFSPNEPMTRGDFATLAYRVEQFLYQEVTMKIIAVEDIDDVVITVGEETPLPKTVQVTYANHRKEDVRVNWDTTALNEFVPGEYELTGTIEDTGFAVSLMVKVQH